MSPCDLGSNLVNVCFPLFRKCEGDSMNKKFKFKILLGKYEKNGSVY